MSSRAQSRLWIMAAALLAPVALVFSLAAPAQYPGQVTNADKNTPTLRAVARASSGPATRPIPKPAASSPSASTTARTCRTRASTSPVPSRLPSKATSSISSMQDGKPSASSTLTPAAREQGGGLATASGSRCPRPNPRRRKWPRSTKTTMRRATCPSCTASIMPTIRPAERAPDRVRVRAPARAVRAPDPDRPTLHKGGDASSGLWRRVLARLGGIRPPTPARLRPIPTGPSCIRSDRQLSFRYLGPSSTSSDDSNRPKLKKKKKEDERATWRTSPASPIPTGRICSAASPAGYGAPVAAQPFRPAARHASRGRRLRRDRSARACVGLHLGQPRRRRQNEGRDGGSCAHGAGLNPPPAAQARAKISLSRTPREARYSASAARSAARRAVPRLRAGLRLGRHHGALRAHRWRRRATRSLSPSLRSPISMATSRCWSRT